MCLKSDRVIRAVKCEGNINESSTQRKMQAYMCDEYKVGSSLACDPPTLWEAVLVNPTRAFASCNWQNSERGQSHSLMASIFPQDVQQVAILCFSSIIVLFHFPLHGQLF